MANIENIKNINIPICGFGTYQLQGQQAIDSVVCALEAGYRHIDTANLYHNEEDIGKAIKKSNISRNEIWITTKVNIRDIKKGINSIYNSILNSLKQLDTEYLDLILLHGPIDGKLEDSWKALEEIILGNVEMLKNKVRYIGVSNYSIIHLNRILPICRIKPYVNQFEVSPYVDKNNLVNYCKKNGIIVVAHTSLTKGNKICDSKLKNISEKINVSEPLILLAWALHHDMVILPRSSNPIHIKENITSIDVKLDVDVMNELNDFHKIDRYFMYTYYAE